MRAKFENQLKEQFPFLWDATLLVACSGGVDSMVLAHLCAGYKLNMALAHCNFNLRGSDSDEDSAFVAKKAKHYRVPFYGISFDTKSMVEKTGDSVQMVARDLRYSWFNELANKEGFDFVLTAHHADDDLETFIINLARGTGIEGLKGIPAINDKVVRPLLAFSRDEIVTYAKKRKLSWREDSSNQETKYLRNKIRHKVIPELKNLNANFLTNFLKTQNHLRATSLLLESTRLQLQTSLFETSDDTIKMSVDKLLRLVPLKPYMHLLFHEFGFTEWDNVADLLTAMSGKEVRSATHRLLKDRQHLILSPLRPKEQVIFYIQEGQKAIAHPITLRIQNVDELGKTTTNALYVDKEKLKYPLLLRKWKNGDYFYPFGMGGKKKVSKFFKDEKMDVFTKESQWLLCSGDAIVWIVGKRADNRFKVTDKTKHIQKIEWKE